MLVTMSAALTPTYAAQINQSRRSPWIAGDGLSDLLDSAKDLFGITASTRALSSRPLPPPALCECRHRGLARRLVAVRRPTVFVVAKGQRPHPRRPDWRGMDLEDATDNSAIDEHIEILVVPFAGRTGGRGALEDQIVLVHFTEPTCAASLNPSGVASDTSTNYCQVCNHLDATYCPVRANACSQQ